MKKAKRTAPPIAEHEHIARRRFEVGSVLRHEAAGAVLNAMLIQAPIATPILRGMTLSELNLMSLRLQMMRDTCRMDADTIDAYCRGKVEKRIVELLRQAERSLTRIHKRVWRLYNSPRSDPQGWRGPDHRKLRDSVAKRGEACLE